MSGTDEFAEWYLGLSSEEQRALEARIDLLAERGPSLRRPAVGEIKGSRYDPQMKELIVERGAASLRVLFVFDPRREAILLVGGDKAGNWRGWYRETIPQADRMYEEYLDQLRQEGLI